MGCLHLVVLMLKPPLLPMGFSKDQAGKVYIYRHS